MQASADNGLSGELDPEERLIWRGQPAQGLCPYGASESVGLVMGTLFLVAWTGGISVVVLKNLAEHQPVGRTLPGIAFGLVGILSLIILLYLEPQSRRRTVYALTDRRILIVTGRFTRRVESLPLRTMRATNVRIVDGGAKPGKIAFADFAQRCGYGGNDLCYPEFTAVRDANLVGPLIRAAIAAAAKREARETRWVSAVNRDVTIP